ncbi:MAG: UvrD-helicase domain-containing protein, partial [Candidatus Competibacteraceae bacterium]|nr:UvrD-helicase domain-containing protein [Candidatus Competibacteraceae bacterium]
MTTDIRLTAEQNIILERVRTTTNNLAIEARAGAAKTTTLVEIAKALAGKTILALAFNKKIATEMNDRLPEGAIAKTLNALGDRAIRDFRGKFHKLEDKKCYEILTSLIHKLEVEEQEESYERFAETLAAIRTAKNVGYLPEGAHSMMKSLYAADDFYSSLDEEPSDLQRVLIDKALRISIKMVFDEGFVDFADQLYVSTLHKSISFPRFEVVLVDEAQDLSELNHIMLSKLVRGSTRLIIVGDPCQAIYSFRGASEESMPQLVKRFD